MVLASMYVALLTKATHESGDEVRALGVFAWVLITTSLVMIAVVLVEPVLLARNWRMLMSSAQQGSRPVCRPTSWNSEHIGSGHTTPAMGY